MNTPLSAHACAEAATASLLPVATVARSHARWRKDAPDHVGGSVHASVLIVHRDPALHRDAHHSSYGIVESVCKVVTLTSASVAETESSSIEVEASASCASSKSAIGPYDTRYMADSNSMAHCGFEARVRSKVGDARHGRVDPLQMDRAIRGGYGQQIVAEFECAEKIRPGNLFFLDRKG